MPITTPAGTTARTVTFWYPAAAKGFTDWSIPLSVMFDDDLRPHPRLLAHPPRTAHEQTLLAAPKPGTPLKCAGGRLDLLDLPGTGEHAAHEARTRYDLWSRSSRIRGRRPNPLESALLQAGERTYVTYHRLRRVVGDVLIDMRSTDWVMPAAATPEALIDYVHHAAYRLSDAAPDDVLVAVTV